MTAPESGREHEHGPEECVFCKIVNNRLPASKIAETDLSLSFISLEGHPLVIPKKHIEKDDIGSDPEALADVFKLVQRLLPVIRKAYGVEDLNIFSALGKAAGQEVPHFHIHLIPREPGDKKVRVRIDSVSAESIAHAAEQLNNILKMQAT